MILLVLLRLSMQVWFIPYVFYCELHYIYEWLEHFGQMVVSTGLRETGAVASARAAEIYGLDVLAEKIQVRLPFQFCISQAYITWIKSVAPLNT